MAGPPRSPPPTRRGSAPFSSGPRRWRPRRARARRRARRARGAPRRSPSLAGRSRRPHPRRLPPIRAAVSPAVFPAEATRLPGRPEHLRPPAVLEDAHVAPREDLERPLHFPGVIELRRVGFTESLEPRGVDEVAHGDAADRSEEHTSELQSQSNLVCRLLLEKKKQETLLYRFTKKKY